MDLLCRKRTDFSLLNSRCKYCIFVRHLPVLLLIHVPKFVIEFGALLNYSALTEHSDCCTFTTVICSMHHFIDMTMTMGLRLVCKKSTALWLWNSCSAVDWLNQFHALHLCSCICSDLDSAVHDVIHALLGVEYAAKGVVLQSSSCHALHLSCQSKAGLDSVLPPVGQVSAWFQAITGSERDASRLLFRVV